MLIFVLINLSNDDFVPVTIVLNVLISPKLEKENFILKSDDAFFQSDWIGVC